MDCFKIKFNSMKFRLIVLFFLFFYGSFLCASQIKNDLVKENISGVVKSIVENEYILNNDGTHSGIPFKKVFNYNMKGYLMSEIFYEDTVKVEQTIQYTEELSSNLVKRHFKKIKKP